MHRPLRGLASSRAVGRECFCVGSAAVLVLQQVPVLQLAAVLCQLFFRAVALLQVSVCRAAADQQSF
jgi:hypothetical protein